MTPAAVALLLVGDQDWWEQSGCCYSSFAGYERIARLAVGALSVLMTNI